MHNTAFNLLVLPLCVCVNGCEGVRGMPCSHASGWLDGGWWFCKRRQRGHGLRTLFSRQLQQHAIQASL